ncbi:phosphoribosyltransferase [Azotobacter chroococcum]|uniref:phosphoribosyltransferase n=1 Tax=Azotobacter chroococcum TaxID=353 RepID=UPI0010ADD883|nr:phosphoribosyltransferase family protein [Azotobacter chroococcum]TKD35813.1 phosphoribosyltransferase [Azotobacter chroococcum]
MNFISYADLSEDIRKNMHKLHGREIDLVVGIPRSGMIPAYMIALYLNVNCLDLASLCRNEKPVNGRTRKTSNNLAHAWDAKKILLVDDSIMSGISMRSAVKQLPDELVEKLIKMAVYSASTTPREVDIYFEHVACPRVFEWNIYHHDVLAGSCSDIDGTLCVNPTKGQSEDDGKYMHFLTNAKPLNLPSRKIHSLISSRLEKYRKETETWLKEHNIKYEHLIMLDLPSNRHRESHKIYANHKAEHYNKSKLDFFFESEPDQALAIAKATSKPVYCSGNNRVYQSSALESIYTAPSFWVLRNICKKLKQSLPDPARRH